jgi:hypothetical protein
MTQSWDEGFFSGCGCGDSRLPFPAFDADRDRFPSSRRREKRPGVGVPFVGWSGGEGGWWWWDLSEKSVWSFSEKVVFPPLAFPGDDDELDDEADEHDEEEEVEEVLCLAEAEEEFFEFEFEGWECL